MKILKCPRCEKKAKRLYTRTEINGKDVWLKTPYVLCEAGHIERL